MIKICKIIIITLIVTIVSAIFPQSINANSQSYNLYSKGEMKNLLIYQNIKVATQLVFYQTNGVEYPAYCLNRYTGGITLDNSYEVTATQQVSNELVWKAIISGYPYKTVQELGCNCYEEAYVATKMAVYNMLYDYNYDDFQAIGEAGSRVFEAMKRISSNARNQVGKRQVANITIEEEEDWKIEGEFLTKMFNIKTSIANQKYNVKISDSENLGIKITDISNKEKNTFNSNEKFKLHIPILKSVKDGSFTVTVDSKMKTNPILFGLAPNPNLQDYALTMYEYESVSVDTHEEYLKNDTKIIVLKKDGETGCPLSNVKFCLLDENKMEIKNDLVTNEKGEIIIENLLPGKYFLKENEAAIGYEDYKDLREVDVTYNELKEVEIDNFKIEQPNIMEETQEIYETQEVQETEVIKLPRTGK